MRAHLIGGAIKTLASGSVLGMRAMSLIGWADFYKVFPIRLVWEGSGLCGLYDSIVLAGVVADLYQKASLSAAFRGCIAGTINRKQLRRWLAAEGVLKRIKEEHFRTSLRLQHYKNHAVTLGLGAQCDSRHPSRVCKAH